MMTTANVLAHLPGKVPATLIGSVTSQLLTAQQINAEGVAGDQLLEQLKNLE
jgi:hypothetical protein